MSDVSNYGERSASEHECASGGEIDEVAGGGDELVCRPCGGPNGLGGGGADGGGMSGVRRADRSRAQDVGALRNRMMGKMGDYARSFIKERHALYETKHRSRPPGRFLISADEKQMLLDGWLRCVQRRDEMNGRVLSRRM